jgi:hypothetical protein
MLAGRRTSKFILLTTIERKIEREVRKNQLVDLNEYLLSLEALLYNHEKFVQKSQKLDALEKKITLKFRTLKD